MIHRRSILVSALLTGAHVEGELLRARVKTAHHVRKPNPKTHQHKKERNNVTSTSTSAFFPPPENLSFLWLQRSEN